MVLFVVLLVTQTFVCSDCLLASSSMNPAVSPPCVSVPVGLATKHEDNNTKIHYLVINVIVLIIQLIKSKFGI